MHSSLYRFSAVVVGPGPPHNGVSLVSSVDELDWRGLMLEREAERKVEREVEEDWRGLMVERKVEEGCS